MTILVGLIFIIACVLIAIVGYKKGFWGTRKAKYTLLSYALLSIMSIAISSNFTNGLEEVAFPIIIGAVILILTDANAREKRKVEELETVISLALRGIVLIFVSSALLVLMGGSLINITTKSLSGIVILLVALALRNSQRTREWV